MNALISAGIALIGAAVGIAGYICIRRIIMKGRKDSIIEKAELEAETVSYTHLRAHET